MKALRPALRPAVLCVLLVAPCAFSAFGAYIVATVNLTPLQYAPYTMTSGGSAIYYDFFSNQAPANLSGTHAIRGDDNSTAAAETVNASNGQWAGTLGGIAGVPGVCYRARVDASGGGESQGVASSLVCYPAQPPPPPPTPTPTGGGSPSPDPGGTYTEDLPCFPGIDSWCSPIVINFENGDYRLTGSNSPVRFDIRGDGHPLLMGWTAAGANEAFLWLDRNHNHAVTSGAELFGNFTRLRNGQFAENGFEALAELDDNHDGLIDDRDAIWPQLQLWRDLNHDGISQPDEIQYLSASGVTAIDLRYHWTDRHDTWGNGFRYESLVSITDEMGHASHKRPVYDIFFVSPR